MEGRREWPKAWRPLPLLGLWLVSGGVLSVATGRVRDWFDMTDELRYERLAISIARTGSLVPRIHDVDVKSFSQLYPLLIAPLFRHGLLPHDVRDAHVLNAWLMASACIPAYLLARRVVGPRFGYFAAALSVLMPWIFYATMLMTEVAAYPAFLWALLAIDRAVVRPSPPRDLLAVLGLALAFGGRTELLALVFVPPPAIVAYELGRVEAGSSVRDRVLLGLRRAVASHPLLTVVYLALAVTGIVVYLEGSLSEVVGVYGIYAQQNTLFPPGTFGSFATHVAVFALGFGLLPFLVGAAWLLANVVRPDADGERHAFACVSAFTLLAIFFQGTNFDIRYTGFVHDRFLLYLVPPVLIGMCCALQAARLPRLSLALVTAVTAVGFATGSFPGFTWSQFDTLTQDSPMSGTLRRLVDGLGGSLSTVRWTLAGACVVLAVLFLGAARLLRRDRLVAATAAFTVAGLCFTTYQTFHRFFTESGWSGRPVTSAAVDDISWIDQAVGTHADVAQIPYLTTSDYFESEGGWRDLEFFNASLTRDVLFPGGDVYAYTGIWFPKLDLALDPRTGRANISPAALVVSSDKDTRFALAGTEVASNGDLRLLRPSMPWRAQWLSSGFYDDGWTKPGVTARIRIFPFPGQRAGQIRTFAFAVRPPDGAKPRRVTIVSNEGRFSQVVGAEGTVVSQLHVCVPARGFTEIRISTPVSGPIPVDQAFPTTDSRDGGVFFGEAAIADEVAGACSP